MSSLIETLFKQFSGDSLKKISNQLGADERSVGGTISAALPLLIKALSRNASDEGGAQALSNALSRDHDGSILDNLTEFLDNPDASPGDGILRHVLGDRRQAVESGFSRSSGLDPGSVSKLMGMIAPVVMGTLGRTMRDKQMDTTSLSGYLGREREELERAEPQAMGALGNLLDADGDGDFDMGDIAKHGFGLLGKFFGG